MFFLHQLAAEPSVGLNKSNISFMNGKHPARFYQYTGCKRKKKHVPKYLKYYCIKAEVERRIFSKRTKNRISQKVQCFFS